MTFTWDNHFKWLHLTAFHWNIETITQARNQNHLVRVYLFPSSMYLTYAANCFSCFQLDIEHQFFFKNNSKLDVMSSVVKLMLFFLHKSMGIIESGMGGMTSLLKIITLLFYITKSSWRQSSCRRVFIKCCIFLNISILVYFISSLCLIGENPRR